MTNKYLKYNHPSAMKYDVNKTYELEELKKELDLEMIKILFDPIGWNWGDLVEKIVKEEVISEKEVKTAYK